MCGLSSSNLILAKVEGTTMKLCPNCVRYGKTFADNSTRVNNFNSSRPKRSYVDPEANLTLIKNYPSLIKSSRENKGLKQSEVAKKLNEKESLMHSIESGNLRPSFKTARKLEKFFGIKLIEEIPDVAIQDISPQEETTPLTMGDLLKNALKKKK